MRNMTQLLEHTQPKHDTFMDREVIVDPVVMSLMVRVVCQICVQWPDEESLPHVMAMGDMAAIANDPDALREMSKYLSTLS